MKQYLRPASILAVSLGISIYCLYIFGNTYRIIAYEHPYNLPTIKMWLLHAFLVSTMSYSIFRLLDAFLAVRPTVKLYLILCSLLSLFLEVFLLGGFTYSPQPYILIGDYLRDSHGINWYYMDMSGWSPTAWLYLNPILTLRFYRIYQKHISNPQVKEKSA